MLENLELPFHSALETEEVKLDTADEAQALHDLNAQLQILEDAKKEIVATQAVGRDQVKELVDECGMTLSEDYPLNSYTQQPSKTNLTVTVEGIFQTAKSILKAILVKIKEILRKIFDFLRSILDKYFSYSKNYIKLRDNLAVLLATDAEMAKLIATHQAAVDDATLARVLGSDKALYDRYTQEVEVLQKQWSDNYSDLVDAILSNQSPYIVALRTATIATNHAFTQVRSKISLLNAVAAETHRDPNQPSVLKDILTKLADVARPIDITAFQAAVGMIRSHHDRMQYDSLKACADQIHGESIALAGSHGAKASDLLAVGTFFVSHHVPFEELPIPAEQLLKEINAYSKVVSELQTENPIEDQEGLIAQSFTIAAKELMNEFTGLQMLLYDAVRANAIIYQSMTMASRAYYAQINRCMLLARASNDAELISNCEKAMDEARRKLKPF